MLSKLAKIANRLDSIGLTKEADVLDAFIRKAADGLDGGDYDTETSVPSVKPVDINLVAEDIANNINNENPSISRTNFVTEFMKRFTGSSAKPSYDPSNKWGKDAAYSMASKQWDLLQSKVSSSDKSNSAPATGWEAYLSKAGPMGMEVKKAWGDYSASGVPGVNPSFSSFTSWYNRNLKGPWGGKHKTPSEVIKLIKSEKSWEVSMADPWGSGSGPAQADRSSSMGTGAFSGVEPSDANLGRAWRDAATMGPDRYKR